MHAPVVASKISGSTELSILPHMPNLSVTRHKCLNYPHIVINHISEKRTNFITCFAKNPPLSEDLLKKLFRNNDIAWPLKQILVPRLSGGTESPVCGLPPLLASLSSWTRRFQAILRFLLRRRRRRRRQR